MATALQIADFIFTRCGPLQHGTFIEVGAADPVDISVSFLLRPLAEQRRLWAFRQAHPWLGKEPVGQWDIISVEPNPDLCREFRKMVLSVLEYAACDRDIGETDFRVSPCPLSASALEVRYPGPHPIENGAGGWWASDAFNTIKVQALTLNTILRQHHPNLTKVDAIVVDTEGWELEVLRGFDFGRYNPTVIVLENVAGSKDYQPYMEAHGYRLDHSIEQDQLYVR